jgi:insertion element IS1 protein InsB
VQTLQPAQENDVLELDELWSFVYRRKDKQWIWLAQCRRTRQIVAYAVGDRSAVTCRRLWQRVPPAYRQSVCFTDFWEAYKKVIPPGQHRPGGKGAGQTCHIERFNNTLRQRLARLVRQTMSFSKSVKMHKICLALFIYDYNRSRSNNRN